MTSIARQFGLTGDNVVVDGPVMNGSWIALDDISGDLPGGVYEIDNDTGALRELPAEQSPPAHQPKETAMSSHYYDTSSGRPVELAGIPGTEGLGEMDLGDAGTGSHYVGSQANAERLQAYSRTWTDNWAASQPPAPPEPVTAPESLRDYAHRADFIFRAHDDPFAQALEARSGTPHAHDAYAYGTEVQERTKIPRNADGSPILGRDMRPLFEQDDHVEHGDVMFTNDGRRAAAETWLEQQRNRSYGPLRDR